MSSQLSSWTNPTWFASMKQGSHIMLQRFVRSTVSTAPRPYLIVLLPWLCSFSSLCARMSLPGNDLLEVAEERRVDRHDVLEVPVLRAILDHQDLAVTLDDLRLDLADLLVQQHRVVALAVQDLLPRLAHADRAQRVGLARPAERRLDLLPRLQQRLLGPGRGERVVRLDAVQRVEHRPHGLGGVGQALLHVLDRLVHMLSHTRTHGRACATPRGRCRQTHHSGFWRRRKDSKPSLGQEDTARQRGRSRTFTEGAISGAERADTPPCGQRNPAQPSGIRGSDRGGRGQALARAAAAVIARRAAALRATNHTRTASSASTTTAYANGSRVSAFTFHQ